MKQKDWTTVAVIVIIAGAFSFFVANFFFGSAQKKGAQVPSVEKITTEFPRPSEDENYKRFYNKNALNPTEIIVIGQDPNTNPFGTPSQ